jgi:maltose/moltooligosaccharide transporter
MKPRLSIIQIINMSIGFMGIQFGWALQMANMSSIYEYLGAEPDKLPFLWLAAPLTGLLVQPIIGYLSDKTWHPLLGRRRPYFLFGAILSSIALVIMPNSPQLWMAAGLLWILDSSINISMEPFRAFVADKLPEEQRTLGFSMQSLFIGLGSVVASSLPWILSHWFGVTNISEKGQIPYNVKISFYIGAAAFITFVLYTVFTTKEYPQTQVEIDELKNRKGGLIHGFNEILDAIRNMPKRMKQLALVQFLTWPGLFLMWFYYTPAVGNFIYGGSADGSSTVIVKDWISIVDQNKLMYTRGTEFAGLTYSFQNIITFLFAFLIPFLASKLSNKYTHMLCLIIGGIGLLSINFIDKESVLGLYGVMACVGIAWSSILSMPYSMLSGCLPENKIGIYMGIFNFFIVLPEIIAALFFGDFMKNILHNNQIYGVMCGGVLLIIAAILTTRITSDN